MSDPSELTRERSIHAPEVMREAEAATATRTAVMEPQLREIKKESWISSLFSKKSVSRLIRLFKKDGKEYGLENTFEAKKDKRLQDFHMRIQVEIEEVAYAANHPAYNDFVAVMQAIDKYSSAGSIDAESEAINQSRALIAAFKNKYAINPDAEEPMDTARQEFLNRLEMINLMFETQTNGNLQVPEETSVVLDEQIGKSAYMKWEDCKDKQLFTHEPCATDVQQRLTEDCYMMSALSSMALMRPELIKDSIRDNGDTVTVRFYEKADREEFFAGRTLADCQREGQIDSKKLLELALAKVAKGEITSTSNDSASDDDDDDFEMLDETEVKVAALKGFLDSNNEAWLSEIASRLMNDDRITTVIQGATGLDDALVLRLIDGVISAIGTDYDAMERTIRRETDVTRTKMKESYVTVNKSVTKIRLTNANANAVDCLWVQMIEKAYAAKFNRDGDVASTPGYDQISRGNSYHFLTALTGDDRYINKPIGNDADAVFDEITRRIKAKQIITVASNASEKDEVKALNSRGIRAGHAYSVLGTTVVDNTKFVAIRDPYGLFTTSYDLEDGQTVAQGKKVSTGGVGLSMGDSKGISYMEIGDFMSTFTNFSGILK